MVAAFLGRLTPSVIAVGAAAAIARFGWLLPQLFAANYAQGVRYRKPIYLLGAGGRAIALGSLAAVLLWPTDLHGSHFQIFLRDGRRVLRRDPRFRLFLYAQLLGGVTKMAIPFYVVQARQVSGHHELEVGTLLAAQAVGGISFSDLLGGRADNRGAAEAVRRRRTKSSLAVTGSGSTV